MPSGGGEGSRCIEGVHDGCTQASTYFLLSCSSTQLLFLQRGLFDGWVWLQPRHSGSSGGKADSRVRAGRRATMAQTFEMSNSRDGRWRRCTLGDICLRRSEEHTSELQSRLHLVCRLLLEKKKKHHIALRT